MSEQQSELLPCPFCGAGDTQIEGKGMWTGQGYSEPISVSVRHWCTEVPGQPSRMIERIGRDRASAIEAWNRRAALSKPSTEQGWTHEINQELERQYLKGFQAGKAFAVSEQGWRTIESAPRDGTMFLCWVRAERYGETDEGQQYQHDESQVDFCWWRTLAESPDGGYFDPACGQIGDRQFVSHWMPLPPPPIEPREEKL